MDPTLKHALEKSCPEFKQHPGSLIIPPGIDMSELEIECEMDLDMIEGLYRIAQEEPHAVCLDADSIHKITDFAVHLPHPVYFLWDPTTAAGGSILRASSTFKQVPLPNLKEALLEIAEMGQAANLTSGGPKTNLGKRQIAAGETFGNIKPEVATEEKEDEIDS
jgi:hypothetical protein